MKKRYSKIPVEIEATELIYSTESQEGIIDWANEYDVKITKGPDGSLNIETLEGTMRAVTGDFIIKGVNDEFYPCKPDIFSKTYQKINK
ncbi:hypothetical protein [Chryseobacterium sp. WLY505]|uniref:hypothetical protein n=1 Tax=Chryseobacterium sp. WLY505 TaxID=3068892 RepID=UPI002796C9B2|nr:hypothetical protein [Chryseobacterium sp. WLY505]MDQ1859037.1 hypothetical protein [Chryseobacterium sp. WLY505]